MTKDLNKLRLELRDLNLRAWKNESVFITKPKLDSSLKKNTGFIKKIKASLTFDSYKSIIIDIESVSLEKYLAEIISSLWIGLQKVSKNEDISATLEVVSALHQRFVKSFTPILFSKFIQELTSSGSSVESDGEKQDARDSKAKALFKLFTEFHLIGLFHSFDDCDYDMFDRQLVKRMQKLKDTNVLLFFLKIVLDDDFKVGSSLGIAQSFLRRFNHLLSEENPLIDQNVKLSISKVFKVYSTAVFHQTVLLNKQLASLNQSREEASIRTGKISHERQNRIDEYADLYEKFKVAALFLSSELGLSMPVLQEAKLLGDPIENSMVANVTISNSELGVWETPKIKDFYTKFVTIKATSKADPTNSQDSVSGGEKINDFLDRLQTFDGGEDIDALAREFSDMGLNNKATQKRLLKFFIETPNVNNLSYYCRFLKTLEVPLSPLIKDLIEIVDRGFRSQMYRNSLNIKNVILFSELVKFKLVPSHVIFHKFRTLTLDLQTPNNIDILAVLYENCGRYLLYEPEFSSNMLEMMELLKQKAKSDVLSANHKLAINNIINIFSPMNVNSTEEENPREDSTPLQDFVKRLVTVELSQSSYPYIETYFKKYELAKHDSLQILLKHVFSSPNEVNYDNIPILAKLLKKVTVNSSNLLISVIDELMESIQRGLECNNYRENRGRLATIRYVSALYNEAILDFKCITDLAIRIISFGHPGNQPLVDNYNVEIDLPDSYFRIRLICMLIIELNMKDMIYSSKLSVNTEQNQKYLEFLIAYFQYYCFTKRQPFPMDIQFKINELMEKFHSCIEFVQTDSLRESLVEVSKAMAKLRTEEPKADTSGNSKTLDDTMSKKSIMNDSGNGREQNPQNGAEVDSFKGTKSEAFLNNKTLYDSSSKSYNNRDASIQTIGPQLFGEDDELIDLNEEEDTYEEDYDEDDDEDDEGNDEDDDDVEDEEEEDDDDDEGEDEEEEEDYDDDDDQNDEGEVEEVEEVEEELDVELDVDGDEYETYYSESYSENESEVDEELLVSEEDGKFIDQLDKDFQKLVFDSYAAGMKFNSSKSKLSIPLPTHSKSNSPQVQNGDVSISLLTRSGKKTNVKELRVNANSSFGTSILQEKALQRNQKKEIISRVLNMDS